ncbi:peptidoglycan recognition protein family protein [Alkalicoccobacillus plakortidis]|uniref:Autolysin n=1 Tax=Alkalicoccobacillus plakortidis TaxID=444060 RepID=A0ABT0XI20_9BACI|nr:N-acetylmuramoyl-L-alanine amidase [Alkalicoccobacillus plakortidis]MCM2675561.1 N-acetylmuramoyl-L-alanine amidase [Alkalicoccobacillus plakortidis]
MTKIHDIRKSVRGGKSKRALSRVNRIARHHSGTTGGDYFSFGKRWFDQLGWSTGGYHEIILPDGSIQFCYDPDVITNGVGGHNTGTYHICVVGNGQFTAEQEKTWNERAAYWQKRLGIPLANVLGHREFQGASTACPGINMDQVRKALGEGKTYTPPKTEVKPVTVTAPTPSKPRTLRLDTKNMMNGEDVKKVQRAVGVKADGWFGSETDKAVRAYQASLNLDADGIVGALTWEAIDTGRKPEPKKPAPAPKPTKKKYVLPTKVLRRGNKGKDVGLLQTALNAANYNVGRVDDDYGPKTQDAVRRFQKVYLPREVDGIAGPNTYRELDKVVN